MIAYDQEKTGEFFSCFNEIPVLKYKSHKCRCVCKPGQPRQISVKKGFLSEFSCQAQPSLKHNINCKKSEKWFDLIREKNQHKVNKKGKDKREHQIGFQICIRLAKTWFND